MSKYEQSRAWLAVQLTQQLKRLREVNTLSIEDTALIQEIEAWLKYEEARRIEALKARMQ